MSLPVAAPTETQTKRIKLAITHKATRFLVMLEAPLGTWGEISEFGAQAVIRPDYEIKELLYGLHRTVDGDMAGLTDLVTTDDVIRAGLQLDPSSFPSARLPDVQAAIDAAADWVVTNINQSWGIG